LNQISQKERDALTRIRVPSAMPIKLLNLTLESEVIEEIKIQAVREARSVSDIARELFREYLDRQVKLKVKAKSK
jgi:hypothetical protein